MKNLELFADDLKGGQPPNPPYRISAGKLDRNFKKVSPREQSGEGKTGYTVEPHDDGWQLMPQVRVTICEDGEARDYYFIAVPADG
jgi:hypothetical protein